ncbi:ribonuclease T2 family protein [Swaminathania salitolerans]|uniref:Ribonuclease I n=1 Tax=Swaminathania salitolerans TaxID=182838 RepID=A0A511BP74_9PROT|nr:ribonuclease I [Swaminathania salitolerans]GBQ16293.1 ribonuclease I [Swaminathania salitolerans LMG 21291]GEL01663.1 ribonuclease I [Swaminathania salitolerans]
MKRLFLSLAVLATASCATGPEPDASFTAQRNTDFSHETLALTWQPGFCTTGKGCMPDQPDTPLIGLHGLWASEPHSLEARGVPVEKWWQNGCALLGERETAPVLDSAMQATLSEIVPHIVPSRASPSGGASSLVDHEWGKHGACFGYRPGPFFAEAVSLRLRFARSPVGAYLRARQGTLIERDALLGFFRNATGVSHARALQLRCERDDRGRIALTQLWFTLKPDRLDTFPAGESYLEAPHEQGNCPAQFWLKRWEKTGAVNSETLLPHGNL